MPRIFSLADPRSGAYAAISGRTVIGPIIEVHVVQPLGNHGLELKNSIFVQSRKKSWVEVHIPDPRHNHNSPESLSEQAIAKEGEPCFTELEQSSIVLYERNYNCERKEVERVFQLFHHSMGNLFQPRPRSWS